MDKKKPERKEKQLLLLDGKREDDKEVGGEAGTSRKEPAGKGVRKEYKNRKKIGKRVKRSYLWRRTIAVDRWTKKLARRLTRGKKESVSFGSS